MKSILGVFLILGTLSVWAAEGDLGVGAMIGAPTGFSGKYWLSETAAVDAGLGFSFGSDTKMSVHSDYLIHSNGALVMNDVHPLDVYAGLGGRIKFGDDIQLGARIPVGVAYKAQEQNADMFAEVAPVIDFVSRFGVDLNLMFGARYYFH